RAISRAALWVGASLVSRSSRVTPSAFDTVRRSLSRGSRLPFSSTLTCDAARPIATPRSSSVIPRLVRSWRMRLPMVSESDISLWCGSSDVAGGIRPEFHAQILKKTEKARFFCALRVEAEPQRVESLQDHVAPPAVVVGLVERPSGGLDAHGRDRFGREGERL